jgi:glycosyltransferase involved in cell wall biosynthesis
MQQELQELASQLTCPVTFHGWLHHDSPVLRELYETSAIFCLPSSNENASVALLEAMLAGMAVVTSNVSGCPETVGNTALLVTPGNVDELRTALARFVDSQELRDHYANLARNRVLQHFDWATIGQQYLAVLGQAAAPLDSSAT